MYSLLKKGNSSPDISVLMSVYNSEEYLAESIKSILNQTFKNFEFLIIDDGSTDKSLEIISSYNDKRIVLIKNKNNLGLAASLNKGMKLAKGKYIARMDADDIALPTRLDKQFSFMENNRDIDISGSYVQFFGNDRDTIVKYPLENEDIKARLIFNCAFAHPVVILRKNSFLDKNLFYDKAVKHAEDYELWSRVAQSCRMANIPEVLLRYRLHKDQVSKKYNLNQLDDAKIARLSLLQNLGIDIKDIDYDVHSEISYRKNPKCEIMMPWLAKITEANKKSGYCSEKALNDVVHNFLLQCKQR